MASVRSDTANTMSATRWDDTIRCGCPRVEDPPPRPCGQRRRGPTSRTRPRGDYTGAEREHPELVALVVREKWASDRGLCLSKELVSQVANSRWYGTANVLSPSTVSIGQ